MKILLTGPSGRIGPYIIDNLRDQFEIVTFDLPGRGGDFDGDLSEIEPLRAAMRGVDAVVHLAATSDDAPFLEALVPNNIIGTHNVFEAARLEGVKRMVFASSCQASGHVPTLEEDGVAVEVDLLPRPGNMYGASKVLGETMGWVYKSRYGMEFIALRLGAFQTYDSEWLKTGQAEEIWLSPRDCAHIIALALTKEGIKFAVVNATSKTSKEVLPLEGAAKALGFEPQDDSKDFFSAHVFQN
ncbi:NAD(P)-dependent oxidoreductase [bacterium]|nr:MAG: NAD(P)-dependent oxidoreductase [bacterium]